MLKDDVVLVVIIVLICLATLSVAILEFVAGQMFMAYVYKTLWAWL